MIILLPCLLLSHRVLCYCERIIIPCLLRHVKCFRDHLLDIVRQFGPDVYPLLCELSLAMDGVLVRSVLNHLHPLSLLTLLVTVLGNHVQLTYLVLNKETLTSAHFGLCDCYLLHCYGHGYSILLDQHSVSL